MLIQQALGSVLLSCYLLIDDSVGINGPPYAAKLSNSHRETALS